jgi:Integrase core domain
MSEKPAAAAPSAVVKAIVKEAEKVSVEDSAEQLLKDRFDKEFQVKLNALQRYKYKDESDLIKRWPFPSSELSEEQGVYFWQMKDHQDYIILTQDIIHEILEAEWTAMPPATGRARFTSYLKQRYVCGPSQSQVTAFLEANDEHQIHRQRRKSQRTSTSVASAPFKMWAMDLTDIPKRGVYRYLLVIVDLFSKFCYCVPLAKKSGAIVARELDKILGSGARVGAIRSDNGSGKSVSPDKLRSFTTLFKLTRCLCLYVLFTEFKNPEVKEVLDKTQTKQVFSLPGNPLGEFTILPQ